MNIWLRIIAGIILVACIALLVGLVVHEYESWAQGKVDEGDARGTARTKGEWDADVRKRDAEKLALIEQARKEERQFAEAAARGERDAREKSDRQAASDRVARDRAQLAAGGLSSNIAALDGAARDLGIPDAAACPAEFARQRDAAMRARGLLDACSTRYRELGQAADDAWRAITLKLDTALGYINAVAPAH